MSENQPAEQIKITRLPDGKIEIELTGTDEELSLMLANAMAQDEDTAAITLGAIPTFLDAVNMPRSTYAEKILKS